MADGSTADPYAAAPEAWLAAIVDSSDDAIVGKTLDSVIRSWNGGATRIFGYEPREIVGRSVMTLIPPDRKHEETEIVARLVKGERVEHFETIRVRKDGSKVDVSLSISPIRSHSGSIIGAAKIARDITEAKRLLQAKQLLAEQLQDVATELETQLEETNLQLMQAVEDAAQARQRAEAANVAKSAFLATMSHELRTPLNAIIGYVDLLHMGVRGELAPKQREDLVRIRRSADTLLHLIDDVLTFAKLEGGRIEYELEAVPIDKLAASLESFVAPNVALKGLEYRYSSCSADPVVWADRAKVEQILLNLLSNAVKFTDRGCVELICRIDGNRVLLHVRDTGCGIRPEQLNTIFEPFVQGDRSLTRTAEGTGLGLSISRELARAMRGDIHVESTLGRGSTFTLSLPRHA